MATNSQSNEVAVDAGNGVTAKADDLEAIRKAVEDAAAVSAGLWISYLFTSFYIAVAVGAVTHTDLLLENPVKLPFLGIELPLLAFFVLAPILFLIVHAYAMMHFVLLGKKAVHFHDSLYAHYPSIDDAPISNLEDQRNRHIRDGIRRQLPSNIFVQFLAGPGDVRRTVFGRLLRLIAWTTLVVIPIFILLEVQIQFLPYHDVWVTWEHRFILLLDLVLIWWLWKAIVGDGNTGTRRPGRWWSWSKAGLGVALSVTVIWFSFGLALIPGEWQERAGFQRSVYERLFYGPVDPNTHRRMSFWSNTLILPRFNVYDVLKVDDPKKVGWRPYLLSVRLRDLRGAVFDGSFLERTDAWGADLQGASFVSANLQGSALDEVHLEGASLDNANLEGASLVRAHLEAAKLVGASLHGAKLRVAHLSGADLSDARLYGSNLIESDLRGAILDRARVRGSSFAKGQLQGVR